MPGLTDDVRAGDLTPLFLTIVGHVPQPGLDTDGEFTMIATLLDRDPFLGRILTGRIESGTLEVNMPIRAIDVDGNAVEDGRATKVFAFRGLERVPVESAQAGDIVAIAGLTKATVSNTIADPSVTQPIRARPIDPPTLAMSFAVNDSPYAGREGDKVQSRVIRDRLEREAEGNVAIRVTESADQDAFEVAGRGELQLGVLIETMRREGFELSISRPRVLYRDGPERPRGALRDRRHRRRRRARRHGGREDGPAQRRDDRHAPVRRRQDPADLLRPEPRPDRLSRRVPLRHPRHRHHEPPVRALRPLQGPDPGPPERRADLDGARRGGAYALNMLEERGVLFIAPGEKLYEGMVIGENAKPQDLEVNPLKSKQLTNFRARPARTTASA